MLALFHCGQSQHLYKNRNPTHTNLVTTNIRKAVIEYLVDQEYARKRYGPIELWDTSEVTDMSYLFFYGRCPTNQMMPVCADRIKTFNYDISRWDVSSVTSFESMFFNSHMFNADISKWDMSSAENISRIFYGCQHFNRDIGKWDVSSVTESDMMLKGAKNFSWDLSSWSTANAN